MNLKQPGAGYIPWRTFTLTHVDYPDGDLFAKIMAILSLTPLVIVIIHLTVFACKRDLHTLFYGLGTIGNGILNYVLKQIFKEPRPDKGKTLYLRTSLLKVLRVICRRFKKFHILI